MIMSSLLKRKRTFYTVESEASSGFGYAEKE
jgi:hypothetical protein